MRFTNRRAVKAQRPGQVVDSVRQNNQQADIFKFNVANTIEHQLIADLLGTGRSGVPHFNVNATFRTGFAAQIEVSSLQAAARQPDELEISTTGIARSVSAADRVEIRRHRESIELCNVSSG